MWFKTSYFVFFFFFSQLQFSVIKQTASVLKLIFNISMAEVNILLTI